MNLKNKLLLLLLLPYLFIGSIIIAYFYNYNTKNAKIYEKNILNAQGEMLIELLKPYILNYQPNKINRILNDNIFIKRLTIILEFDSERYLKGDRKLYKIGLNILNGVEKGKTTGDYINIVKPIKIDYSNHIWGKLLLIKKTPEKYLHKQTIKRLIIPSVSIFIIIISYILYISYLFSPLKQIRNDALKIMKQQKTSLKSISDNHQEFSILAKTINELIMKNIKEQELLLKKTSSLKNEVEKKTEKMSELVKEQLEKTKELNNLQRDYYIAQKNNSLYILMTGLAHEINNPLTTVVGSFDYLSYMKNTPEKLKKWIKEKMEILFIIKDNLQKAIQINTGKTSESLFNLTAFIKNLVKNKKKYELKGVKKSILIEVPKNIKNLEAEFEKFFNSIERSQPKKVNIVLKQKDSKYILLLNIFYNKYIDEIDYRILFSKHIIVLSYLGDFKIAFKENIIEISLIIDTYTENEKE